MRLTAAILLACGATPLLAQAAPETTGPASDAVLGDWGALGEMAGRDFQLRKAVISVRWIEPNRKLEYTTWIRAWDGWTPMRYIFTLDPSTGVIAASGKMKGTARIEPDGSVSLDYKTKRFYPWIGRAPDGGFRFEKHLYTPLDPASKEGLKLAELEAKGRIGHSEAMAGPPSGPAADRPAIARNMQPVGVAPPSAASKKIPVALSESEIRSRWAPLAALEGKTWYCLGHEPSQWMMRRRISYGEGHLDRSPPVMRLTRADWIEPYQSIRLTTKMSDGRGWTDMISTRSDGRFTMQSEGVSNFATLIGDARVADGAVFFKFGKYKDGYNRPVHNEIWFSLAQGRSSISLELVDPLGYESGSPACLLQPYDAAREDAWAKELEDYRRAWEIRERGQLAANREVARSAAESRQMLANMRAELLSQLGPPQLSRDGRILTGEEAKFEAEVHRRTMAAMAAQATGANSSTTSEQSGLSASSVTQGAAAGGAIIVDDGTAHRARLAEEAAAHAKAQESYDRWQADEAARKAKVAAEQAPGPNTNTGPTCKLGPGCVSPQ